MKNYDEMKRMVAELNMTDDIFFQRVTEDIGASEEMLQIILGTKDFKVIECHTQVRFANLNGKSPVLDLLCQDNKGRFFNVEMQKSDQDDHQKRMRYYASNVDVRNAEKGISYSKLPDIYSIMISEFDIFKDGKTVYHIDRVLRNSGAVQDNGIHELYVNIKGRDEGIVTELMQYIEDSNGYNEKFPRISKRVEQIKENSKEVQDMSGAWEKYIEEGRAEGEARGRAEGEARGRAEVLKVLGISEEEYQKKLKAAQAAQ